MDFVLKSFKPQAVASIADARAGESLKRCFESAIV
jgi:hypothetical protein